MKEVRIHDKTFVETLTEENIMARVADLARLLNREYADHFPLMVPILSGAFVFAADLLRALSFDPEIGFMRLSSYGDGMTTSGKIQSLLELKADVNGRDVLIIEDIVDTGTTIDWLRQHLREKGARTVKVACLLFKHEVFKMQEAPEYYCFRIPNEFVVGYGLDYAEQGRSLRSIYKLKE